MPIRRQITCGGSGPLAGGGWANGESVEHRAPAEHAKREAYPEAVEQAHADFDTLQASELPAPRTAEQAEPAW
ncbi:hypothetical protein ACFWJT_04730 [Streptomyces sp. NPDC127069]|uniref:hypothetical protein n=1 Tax=Streptomyces sp. NPDC127069 TaxID=3347128 RepID=UPI00364B476B